MPNGVLVLSSNSRRLMCFADLLRDDAEDADAEDADAEDAEYEDTEDAEDAEYEDDASVDFILSIISCMI